eukprot:7676234-Pyramimonas_sp.AAC.1
MSLVPTCCASFEARCRNEVVARMLRRPATTPPDFFVEAVGRDGVQIAEYPLFSQCRRSSSAPSSSV